MDAHDLFSSCRVGDLEKVQYLVEARDVELNMRDKWDTTPLYYACLCGHEALVKYLLENGAKCVANTFDGERCLYAALNDRIKKLLKNYKMITSATMRRDLYDEFLRRLRNDSVYSDAIFQVGVEKFEVHKCILACRCPQLHERLQKRLEERKVVNVKSPQVDPKSFTLLLDFVYQGHMQVAQENIPTMLLLAEHCGLSQLQALLEKKLKEKNSFESSKPGVHIEVLSIENDDCRKKLVADLSKLADHAVPSEIEPLMQMPFCPSRKLIYCDLCIMVNDFKFMCHKAFFCLRSDYFKALLRDHFDENVGGQVECINLQDINVDVFKCILYYIYTDNCQLTEEIVFEVLCKADMYLLPGLKKLCALFVEDIIEKENIFAVLEMSRLFNLPKLEDRCAAFIAENLEQVLSDPEMSAIVQEDAQSVKMREDSDTIDIIDSIRYHITSQVQTYSEIETANDKLAIIDDFLDELGLDC
ncbi:ankyrin repeat and BTB/POZ domain-containing protein 1-like [Watersipora subatra]|uniref:ankyrin repeat and BTB/POZ domain-containing protein 1-like n=1 Tax=Watersipora subatra TaxID=2589382 RepID=UPI00355C5085